MKRLVFIALICMFMGPAALADLFNFTVSSAQTTFDGVSTFGTSLSNLSNVVLTREVPVTATTFLTPGTTGSFTLTMQVTNIDNTNFTADGTGTFALTDTAGNTLGGTITGTWDRLGGRWDSFEGTLSSVTFGPGANFVGDTGPVSMSFPASQPWVGSMLELTAVAPWFGAGAAFNQGGGSVLATIVPAPVAVLLGLLGLGTAGLKLRKFV